MVECGKGLSSYCDSSRHSELSILSQHQDINNSPQSREIYDVLHPTGKHNAEMVKMLCSKLRRKSDSSASHELQVLCREISAPLCGRTYNV